MTFICLYYDQPGKDVALCFGCARDVYSLPRLIVYTPILAFYRTNLPIKSAQRYADYEYVEMPHPPAKLVGLASGDRMETAVANSTDQTTYAVVDRTKKASGCGMVLV